MTDQTPSQTQGKPAEQAQPAAPADPGLWYVVHTYSGHENKVATTLKQRVETMNLKDKIFEIVVPTRNIVTVRHGKKRRCHRKNFSRLHFSPNDPGRHVLADSQNHVRSHCICGYG